MDELINDSYLEVAAQKLAYKNVLVINLWISILFLQVKS